jgi:hypothetical protein
LDVHYLNIDGNELHVAPHSQPGFPVVAAGETVEIAIPAFGAPADTTSILPQVIAIRALDATTWSIEE